jgi:hippurate hydrolase
MEDIVDKDMPRLQEIFKDIHANPELGFMETRTAAIVAEELEGLGYEVTGGIGKTGVVGILRNGEGPTFMFRADMDAKFIRYMQSLLFYDACLLLERE